ncbi:MAG: hypothetical protein ACRDKW_04215 [Actinomycetota bacterium]
MTYRRMENQVGMTVALSACAAVFLGYGLTGTDIPALERAIEIGTSIGPDPCRQGMEERCRGS